MSTDEYTMSIGEYQELKRIADALERIAAALEKQNKAPTTYPLPRTPPTVYGPIDPLSPPWTAT